ncbi:MAG: hypothetical protein U0V70_03255 [Terriglobia bacterium]
MSEGGWELVAVVLRIGLLNFTLPRAAHKVRASFISRTQTMRKAAPHKLLITTLMGAYSSLPTALSWRTIHLQQGDSFVKLEI